MFLEAKENLFSVDENGERVQDSRLSGGLSCEAFLELASSQSMVITLFDLTSAPRAQFHISCELHTNEKNEQFGLVYNILHNVN